MVVRLAAIPLTSGFPLGSRVRSRVHRRRRTPAIGSADLVERTSESPTLRLGRVRELADYREILLNEDCIIGARGERYRGHEFHYSEILEDLPGMIYSLRDSRGKDLPAEGFRYKNTLASYVHVHFGSNRRIAEHIAGFIKGERTP